MKPDISEFSYGYALTEDLIRWEGKLLTAAPVFPSLIVEGKSGGGYDLKLEFAGMPLFLQFKLSDYMRRGEVEFANKIFAEPFYRMHLRSRKRSRQHELLLELESAGNEVYYVAPKFHEVVELNDAYANKRIVNRSVFVPPSSIGKLPDDEEHHLSFQNTGTVYLFSSSPRPIQMLDGDAFTRKMMARLEQQENYGVIKTETLSETMLKIVESYFGHRWLQDLAQLENMNPKARIAYISRVFFNCELYDVQAREPQHPVE